MRAVGERVRQFRDASVPPSPDDYALARDWLGDGRLYELFAGQEPRDVRHAAGTARWLIERGDRDGDLVIAAFLHDIGKGSQRRLDRVAWVLSELIGAGPVLAREHSRIEMRRAMARTATHPLAGARLLTAAGAAERVVQLTARHHLPPERDAMLALLQAADAAS